MTNTPTSSTHRSNHWFARMLRNIMLWFIADPTAVSQDDTQADRVDWARVIPFVGMHLMCLAVIWVSWSPIALTVALAAYLIRMFAITGFYHRYFSHRTFKTSRVAQFIFGVMGASAVQRGPVWWAAHHRHHHAHSDQPDDPHSPLHQGFWRAHMGWFLTRKGFTPDMQRVRDLQNYPELRFLDRFDIAIPVLMGFGMLKLGQYLQAHSPELGTSGMQMLVWGFFISTVVCYHGTYTINSLSHVFGRQRYATQDHSKNNWLLAIITLGEGWHNNHHHYPVSTRQGFYWWEIDITYYILKLMSWLGLIWDLKAVPQAVRADHASIAKGKH